MSSDEDLERAERQASDAYEKARSAVADTLGSISRDDLDGVLSLAEEFGASWARGMIEADPSSYGLESEQPEAGFDQLEENLRVYVDAVYALDRAVAELVQRGIEQGASPDARVVAVHGELPVVDLVNQTVTFPDRPPEILVLRAGTRPDAPEPDPDYERRRPRGRGR